MASSALARRRSLGHHRGNRAIGIDREVKGEVYEEVRYRAVADYREGDGPGLLDTDLAVEDEIIRQVGGVLVALAVSAGEQSVLVSDEVEDAGAVEGRLRREV